MRLTVDVNFVDAEFEESKHPRGEGGKFGPGPKTRYGTHVESAQNVKGNAEYHVHQQSGNDAYKHRVTLKPSGELKSHTVRNPMSSYEGTLSKSQSRQNPDIHEAIRKHYEQHGQVADPDTGPASDPRKKFDVGQSVRRNAAASKKVQRLF